MSVSFLQRCAKAIIKGIKGDLPFHKYAETDNTENPSGVLTR